MSIEGGLFKCFIHDNFSTDNVKEWDDHCFTTGHTLTVVQQCPDCGKELKEDNHPYPEDYVKKAHSSQPSFFLDCPDCKEAQK